MPDFWKKNFILTIVLAISVVAALILCARRWAAESGDRFVTVIMPYESVSELAQADGHSVSDWLADLKSAGVSAILLDEAEAGDKAILAALGEAGLRPAVRTDDPAMVQAGFFPALFPVNYPSKQNLSLLRQSGIPLVLIEGTQRLGAVLPENYLSLLDKAFPPMVKCIDLDEDLASRYAIYGYDDAKEIENVLFRAVTDRSVRIILLRPFLNNGKTVADPIQYYEVLSGLKARVSAQNLVLGDDFSFPGRVYPNHVFLFIIYLGLFALGIGLLNSIVNLSRRANFVLLALGGLVSAVFAFIIMIEEGRKIFALSASVLFPCAAVWLLAQLLGETGCAGRKRIFARYAFCLLSCVALSTLGGLFVGAILGSTDYLLELRHFSGVKASQLLPLLYSAFILLKTFCHEKGRSLGGDLSSIQNSLRGHRKLWLVLIVLVIACMVAVFILRTGDSVLRASVPEIRARNFLENILYARPRTKEFLIAFPLLSLAVLFACRGYKAGVWPFAFLASIGFCSVTNSFCHIRAHLSLSLMRTLISAALGLVLGAVLMAAARAVIRSVIRRRC
ncbi:MAG: DUF5693 family protein [Oscillospiraceae bacterium]|jgi:hypothetical protein